MFCTTVVQNKQFNGFTSVWFHKIWWWKPWKGKLGIAETSGVQHDHGVILKVSVKVDIGDSNKPKAIRVHQMQKVGQSTGI